MIQWPETNVNFCRVVNNFASMSYKCLDRVVNNFVSMSYKCLKRVVNNFLSMSYKYMDQVDMETAPNMSKVNNYVWLKWLICLLTVYTPLLINGNEQSNVLTKWASILLYYIWGKVISATFINILVQKWFIWANTNN